MCSGGKQLAVANPNELGKIQSEPSDIENVNKQISEMKSIDEYVVIRASKSLFKEGLFSIKKQNSKGATNSGTPASEET